MDPVTLIVTALAAGAASALQDDAKSAVRTAYARLRDGLRRRFAGRRTGEVALAEHQTDPKMWEPQLRAELEATDAAGDTDLVDAAQALMTLVDEAGSRAGKYDVTIHGGQGIQIGDHNTVVNLFAAELSRGPVVAGNVPQAPPAFQPREDLMAALRAAGPGGRVVRVVTGMRGAGKTQLAAAYARECVDAGWRIVAWVNAEDTQAVLDGLAVIAGRLGISTRDTDLETIGGEVRNRLEADGEHCLIVFDNVTDLGGLRPYVPAAGKARVVITSTVAGAADLGKPLPIDVFTEEESLAFLADRTGGDDPAGARTLAEELGHLPLALAQAAAVVARQRLAYPVYVERLRSIAVRKFLLPVKGDSYPHGVAEAILLSLDAVAAEDPTGVCGDLLAMVSLLSPAGVARALLYAAGPAGVLSAGSPAVDEALGLLSDASLLAYTGDDHSHVVAHRLVMRVVLERRVFDGTLPELAGKVCGLLSAASNLLGDPWRNRAFSRDLVEQGSWLHGHLAGYPHGSAAVAEELLRLRSWALWCRVRLGDSAGPAVEQGRVLVADLERTLGDSHSVTVAARGNLASACWRAGLRDDAIALSEQSLAIYERLYGAMHHETLRARTNLAAAYADAGFPGRAIPLLERTLSDRERVFGTDDPDTLLTRDNLAVGYHMTGRLNEAISLGDRAVAEYKRVLGDEHPDTLTSLSNLAEIYLAAGLTGRAIVLLRETLTCRERLLGDAHPDTQLARNNLAHAYLSGGSRAEAAIPLLERALAGLEQSLGNDHPSTVTARDNLARARLERR
jgi:tetratricopeptide (TPR) repeat protein